MHRPDDWRRSIVVWKHSPQFFDEPDQRGVRNEHPWPQARVSVGLGDHVRRMLDEHRQQIERFRREV
jgi:hypothetical protein